MKKQKSTDMLVEDEQPDIVCVTSPRTRNRACNPDREPCEPRCGPRQCSPCNPWGCRP